MIFGSVSGHFADLWHVKGAKLVFELECSFGVPNLRNIHSTPLESK
jgi:hypothetical protein